MLHINRWLIPLLSVVAFSSASVAEDFASPNLSDYEKPSSGAFRQNISDNANEYIDPFSGTLRRVYTELVMPGEGGLDLVVQRYYNNKQSYSGREVSNSVYQFGGLGRTVLGLGWDLHFGRVWLPQDVTPALWSSSNNRSCQSKYIHSDNNPVLELADGSRQLLLNSDSSSFSHISKQRWVAKCLPKSLDKHKVGGLLVYSPDGKEYTFNRWGLLPYGIGAYYVTKISDPNGNKIEFNYSVEKSTHPTIRLLTVKTSDNRKLTFSYNNENLISRISTNDSRDIKFNYKKVKNIHVFTPVNKYRNAYFLESVKRPDGRAWKYKYTEKRGVERYSLKEVTSPLGMETDYTYDRVNMSFRSDVNTHVVKKKVVNIPYTSGRKEWSYTYNTRRGQQDRTLVIGPSRCEEYYHVGQKTITSGSHGVNRGLWKIGNLMKKQVLDKNGSGCKSSPLQEELYTWNKQLISRQNEARRIKTGPGSIVDKETYTSILTKQVIKRGGQTYTTTYSNHDQYGNPRTIVESGQDKRTINKSYFKPSKYWMIHLPSSEKIVGGNTTSYSYNSRGLVSKINNSGVTTSYSYDSDGNVASATDANGKVTRYQSYYRGVPKKEIRPDGTITSRTVNKTGTVSSETSPNRYTTSFTYDKLNRLTSVLPPKGAGSKVQISYTYTGGLLKTLTRGNFVQKTYYNALGLPYKQIQEGGNQTVTQTASYDTTGRQINISLPYYDGSSKKLISMSYDGLNRLKQKNYPDGASESFNYSGNTLRTTDARGQISSYIYRSYGNPDEKLLMELKEPENMVTKISRNKLGMVTKVTQGGLDRTYGYNNKWFLTTENNPETGSTAYTYDNVGNMLSKTVGSSTYHYQYDGLYRLTGIKYPGSTHSSDITYQYDAVGNVTQVDNNQVTWSYQYDAHNNLLNETATIKAKTDKTTYRFDYGYNAQDVLNIISYPSGHQVSYLPNALGQATQAGHYANNLSYHANGQLNTLRYGNGQILTVSQELNRQRISRIQVGASHSTVDLTYHYDQVGNVTQITDGVHGFNSRILGYDGLNRLTSAKGKWGSAGFSYNGRNDLVAKQLGSQSYNYGYDNQGRLATVAGSKAYRFSYNALGSVTNTGHLTLQYDKSGVNVSSACYNANSHCQADPDFFFRYDGHNRRVATLDKKGNTSYYSLYNQAGQLLYEEDAVNGAVTEYIYVAGQQIAKRKTCSDTDTDGDALPDCVEKHWGFNPNDAADGLADNDGDGISNGMEYTHKTNPELKDTDNDGIQDNFEIQFGLNPIVNDASADPDQDGLTNLQEYQLQTDPKNNDTDKDGIPDGQDPNPRFNVAVLIPILHNILY